MNPTKTETMLGGSEYKVCSRDGSESKLFVKQIPVRLMSQFLEAQGDESRMIELATGLSPDAVDNLAPESHESLIAEIERVNSDFFLRWVERQKARAEKLMPGVLQNRLALPPLTSPPK